MINSRVDEHMLAENDPLLTLLDAGECFAGFMLSKLVQFRLEPIRMSEISP